MRRNNKNKKLMKKIQNHPPFILANFRRFGNF